MEADLKKLGSMAVVLLALMIIVGVVFLIGSNWKNNICEQEDSTNTYTNGVCYEYVNATSSPAITISALTQVGIIETALITLLSFTGLIVLVGIAKILVKMVKGF